MPSMTSHASVRHAVICQRPICSNFFRREPRWTQRSSDPLFWIRSDFHVFQLLVLSSGSDIKECSVQRRTPIVATLGPATERSGILETLLESGLNVARINFAHGSVEELKGRIARLRALADPLPRPVAVLLDLPGPKLRVVLDAPLFVAVDQEGYAWRRHGSDWTDPCNRTGGPGTNQARPQRPFFHHSHGPCRPVGRVRGTVRQIISRTPASASQRNAG